MYVENLTEREKLVLQHITQDLWLDLACEMIRTGQPRSTNPLDPNIIETEEEAIAMLVAGKLEALGMEVKKI